MTRLLLLDTQELGFFGPVNPRNRVLYTHQLREQ